MSVTVLIVDDEENTREFIGAYLAGRGYEIIRAATLAEARNSLRQCLADIILLDVQLPDGYGPILLEETAAMPARPPIILITGYGDIEMAVDAMKNGAHDFLTKPVKFPQLEKSIQRASEIIAMRRELAHIRQSRQEQLDFIVGDTPVMRTVLDHAQRAAQTSISVLLTGETGTGKDVLANYIRQIGPRANKPFIPVNSGAIQSTMFESELFGYEPGAFTSAEKRKLGLMEVADGGILFLDEISTMPPDIQAKLLRAIEEQAFRRLGGTHMIHVDVQILAASNRNLKALIEEGKFREDLYYRLKGIDLHMPPLRERKNDIPELVGLFIRKNNQQMGLNIKDITPRALEVLMAYSWPGNIRELLHIIDRAMLFCDEACLDLPHLPSEIVAVNE
jgi:two-component system response regulator AtoC